MLHSDDAEPLTALSLTETEDAPRSTWTRMILGTLGMGLAVGVVACVVGFVAVRFWLG